MGAHRRAPFSNIGVVVDVLRVRLTSGATRTLVRVQYTRRVVLLVQVAWLMRAVQLVDLTTLTSVDGLANVSRLCAKALRPVRADVCAALRIDPRRASPLRSTLLNNTVQYCSIPVRVRLLLDDREPRRRRVRLSERRFSRCAMSVRRSRASGRVGGARGAVRVHCS